MRAVLKNTRAKIFGVKAVDFKQTYVYNSWYKVKEFDMTEPTRGTINKNVLKAVDLAIENQKEINKQFEQLIMMTQAQAVVIRDIIEDIQVLDKNLDRTMGLVDELDNRL